MSVKLFSDKDDSVLKELYSKLTNKELTEVFNNQYSLQQIKNRAKALGLKKDSDITYKAQITRTGTWQEWEIEILKKHYSSGGPDRCLEFLHDRNRHSIINKAKRMNLRYIERNYAFGPKSHSEETKNKISIAHKGKKFSDDHLENLRNSFHRGEDHHNWKGGRSFKEYGPEFNTKLKQRIKGRDKFTCKLCNKKRSWKRLIIHHIDYNKTNNSENNLITLCIDCHNDHHWRVSEDIQIEQQQFFKTLTGYKSSDLLDSNIQLATT